MWYKNILSANFKILEFILVMHHFITHPLKLNEASLYFVVTVFILLGVLRKVLFLT